MESQLELGGGPEAKVVLSQQVMPDNELASVMKPDVWAVSYPEDEDTSVT